jgi:hypothetical protein
MCDLLLFSEVCPPGKYKHATGDERCQPCPDHSKAPDYGFSECRCNSGYYRAAKDPKNMPCTRKLIYCSTCRMDVPKNTINCKAVVVH